MAHQHKCSTFNPAPPDSNLSITELYEYHALNSPTHPLFAYSDITAGTTTSISYQEAWKGIQKTAQIISGHLSRTPILAGEKRAVIAVLAQSDTLSHIYLSVAIMSLGHVVFPMSPRNGAQITANLLRDTGVRYLFVDKGGPIHELAKEVVQRLSAEGIPIGVFPMLQFSDISADIDVEYALPALEVNDQDTMLILHSSGTTKAPKAIHFSRRGLIKTLNVPYRESRVDWSTKRMATHTNSTFHMMGLFTGVTAAIYKPEPIIPTPANFLASLVADRCEIIFCVPVFIEAWAQDPANIATLKSLDAVMFTGTSLDRGVGDMLADAGVVLQILWASTEIGPATMILPPDMPDPREWEWFKFSNHISLHMEMQDNLENVFEAISTDTSFPPVFNTTYMDKPALSTGDLMERHPSDPSRWRVYGRVDEQLMLSTGENVNPLPMVHTEAIISQDPHIAVAVIFGRQRPHPGLLILPVPQLSFDPRDENRLANFKDLIWPTVERANIQAPIYAHIKKDMILVAGTSPIEYTSKGSVRRASTLHAYASEISEAYRAGSVAPGDVEFPDRAS
ncbi:acetyl-CoA synthetase-like protein [Mycena vulgaris]|nr:acetyl-CoA synthetase-like protein [Mycena vulgaris]